MVDEPVYMDEEAVLESWADFQMEPVAVVGTLPREADEVVYGRGLDCSIAVVQSL